jgi:hypothetical protein
MTCFRSFSFKFNLRDLAATSVSPLGHFVQEMVAPRARPRADIWAA